MVERLELQRHILPIGGLGWSGVTDAIDGA